MWKRNVIIEFVHLKIKEDDQSTQSHSYLEPVLVIKKDRYGYIMMAFIALGMSALFAIFGIIPEFFSTPDPFSKPEQVSVIQRIILQSTRIGIDAKGLPFCII